MVSTFTKEPTSSTTYLADRAPAKAMTGATILEPRVLTVDGDYVAQRTHPLPKAKATMATTAESVHGATSLAGPPSKSRRAAPKEKHVHATSSKAAIAAACARLVSHLPADTEEEQMLRQRQTQHLLSDAFDAAETAAASASVLFAPAPLQASAPPPLEDDDEVLQTLTEPSLFRKKTSKQAVKPYRQKAEETADDKLFDMAIIDRLNDLRTCPQILPSAFTEETEIERGVASLVDAMVDFAISGPPSSITSSSTTDQLSAIMLMQQEEEKQHAFRSPENAPLHLFGFPPNCPLKLARSEEKGRAVIATSDIPLGSLLFTEKPFATALSAAKLKTHCSGCHNQLVSGKRCAACKAVFYCCQSCQLSDWPAHQGECHALGRRRRKGKVNTAPEAVRALGRLLRRRMTEEARTKEEQLKWERQNRDQLWNGVIDSLYERVAALQNHFPSRMADIFHRHLPLVRCLPPFLPPETAESLDVLELLKTSSTFATNALSTSSKDLDVVGVGIYPLISMINHSCVPNATLYINNTMAELRPLRKLKKGEEITINYIDITLPTRMRQKLLRETYYFECQCERCRKPDAKMSLICPQNTCRAEIPIHSDDFELWFPPDEHASLAHVAPSARLQRMVPLTLFDGKDMSPVHCAKCNHQVATADMLSLINWIRQLPLRPSPEDPVLPPPKSFSLLSRQHPAYLRYLKDYLDRSLAAHEFVRTAQITSILLASYNELYPSNHPDVVSRKVLLFKAKLQQIDEVTADIKDLMALQQEGKKCASLVANICGQRSLYIETTKAVEDLSNAIRFRRSRD